MDCLELVVPPLPSLLTVRHSMWEPGQQHFERTFEVYDLLFVRSGTLFMEEEGTGYAIGGEQMLVLEPGKRHRGYAPCEEPTSIYYVHFGHSRPRQTIAADDIPWRGVLPQGTDRDVQPSEQTMYIPKYGRIDFGVIEPLLIRMVDLHRTLSVERALPLHALLGELLAALQRQAHARPRTRSAGLAEAAAQYLELHAEETFSSRRMEEALLYQFDHITRCLRKHTGMTPMQYVQYVRLTRAKALLEQTALSVREIAERVGMPDGSYFGRLFRERTGLTPREYRARKQGRL